MTITVNWTVGLEKYILNLLMPHQAITKLYKMEVDPPCKESLPPPHQADGNKHEATGAVLLLVTLKWSASVA